MIPISMGPQTAYGVGPGDYLAGSRAILYGCLYSRSKLVTGNWVVQLGKISYGLYMLHSLGLLLALSVFHPVRGRQLLATKAISFVVTLVLAFASYRWMSRHS